MKTWLKSLILTVATLNTVSPLHAEVVEIEDLNEVKTFVADLVEHYGESEVLVAFDIDNTILAGRSHLGSDQWYEWQAHLISSGLFKHAVGTSIPALLETQATLYALSSLRETQEDADTVIAFLQNQGVRVMALTARGPVNRDATLRELYANGFDFAKSAPAHQQAEPGRFLPLNPNKPEASGLTHSEMLRYRVQRPREVSYEEGVMMVAGQHKGAMLRTLIHGSGTAPKAVVFVDDKLKNVSHVDDAMKAAGIEVFALRYGKEDKTVEAFEESDKAQVIAEWEELKKVLKRIFPQP